MNGAKRYAAFLMALVQLEDRRAKDAALEKFLLHIKSTGRSRLLPQLLGALRDARKRNEKTAPRMEVAKASEIEEVKNSAENLGIPHSAIRVNATLISGWRALEHNRLTDQSAKQALLDIYQRIARA